MKRRILFINGHLKVGGVERSLVDVLKNFDYSRYDVDLMLFQGKGDYYDEIPSKVHLYDYDVTSMYGALINTLVSSIKQKSFFLFMYRIGVLFGCPNTILKLFCKPLHKHYDAVIAYRTGTANRLAMFYVNADKRISWWHHGEMNIFGKEKEGLAEEYQKADSIVAVSNTCSEMLKKEFPNSASKILTIPNMLCADELIEKSKLYQADLKDCFNIVTVGRMSPEKNMSFCLKVASDLKTKGISFHWNIIGDGDEMEKLKQLQNEYNLQDCVTLLGALSNPYPYVANSNLYFHPSLVESQGLTILEAMALKTPVICVASNGPKGYMRDSNNGIIINADIEEASEAIIRLMGNEDLKNKIIIEAQRTINTYSPEQIIKGIEQILSK